MFSIALCQTTHFSELLPRVGIVLDAQSCPTLCDPMDYSPQAPLPMEFSRQKYWSGFPFPSQGDLPDPGIKPRSPALQVDSTSESPGKPILSIAIHKNCYQVNMV